MAPLGEQADQALARFMAIQERDRVQYGGDQELNRWLFMDRKLARGEAKDLNFYGFLGHSHVLKFFQWLRATPFPDYFDPSTTAPLIQTSTGRDQRVFEQLGIHVDIAVLANMGRYNAQDYLFQRMYSVPERHRLKRVLDFGAGHGRMANLAFGVEASDVRTMVAVDSIPGSYLTQRLYYAALGCRMFDYIDYSGSQHWDFEQVVEEYDVLHIPTWRFDLLPDDFFDLVCCVQVLREIPRQLLLKIIPEFRRVLRPGGALYIRDSNEMHNPNQLPQELLVSSNGFLLEFYPRVANLKDVHGIPRIWRKLDPDLFL
jgi:SAM-dependent methyltransferase